MVECPACTFRNASGALQCSVCDSAIPRRGSSSDHDAVLVLPLRQSTTEDASSITCSACTLRNPLGLEFCEACGLPLYDEEEVKAEDAAPALKRQRVDNDGVVEDLGDSDAIFVRTDNADGPDRIAREQKQDVKDATAGIMENLYAIQRNLPLLTKGRARRVMRLASPPVLHFCQRQSDILGHWSCGYRNVQMLTSSLLTRPSFRETLYGGRSFVPQVMYIQRWIESSWRQGFDPIGMHQMGGAVYGKSSWIGATECVAMLRSFRVRAVLLTAEAKPKPQSDTTQKDEQQRSATGGALDDFIPRDRRSAWGAMGMNLAAQGDSEVQIVGEQRSGDDGWTPGDAVVEFCKLYFTREWATLNLDQTVAQVHTSLEAKAAKVKQRGPSSSSSSSASSFAAQSFFNPRTRDDAARVGGTGPSARGSMYAGETSPTGTSADSGFRPPIYLQHAGHSRTIVGIEEVVKANGEKTYSLLVFDPSSDGPKLFNTTCAQRDWQRLVKRGPHTLRHDAYQMVVVMPRLLDDMELEVAKTMDEVFLTPNVPQRLT